MARKPRIQFRIKEDGVFSKSDLQGIGCRWQLSLKDMGGERNVKIHWFAFMAETELDGEFELILNYTAAENLVSRLQRFLDENKPQQAEDYK